MEGRYLSSAAPGADARKGRLGTVRLAAVPVEAPSPTPPRLAPPRSSGTFPHLPGPSPQAGAMLRWALGPATTPHWLARWWPGPAFRHSEPRYLSDQFTSTQALVCLLSFFRGTPCLALHDSSPCAALLLPLSLALMFRNISPSPYSRLGSQQPSQPWSHVLIPPALAGKLWVG